MDDARSARPALSAAARMVPGVAGAGCAVAGVWGLAGTWWALILAAALLLALDWRLAGPASPRLPGDR